MTDVVVIGAGPNGLVAANLLADAGLEVLVLEEQDKPGGAVRSAELTLPGFQHDVCSAFYPFAAASPAMQRLDLHHHGLRWRHSPLVLAHPTPDGPTVVLSRDPEETAASLERFGAGDGETWRRLTRFWGRAEAPFMRAFTTPFPPVRGAADLAVALRLRGLLQFARLGLVPLRRFADENFRGSGGALLIGANALHADLTPEMPGSAMFGLILCGIGQRHGYPMPEGGAQRLTDALVSRLVSRARGGRVETGERVERVLVQGGRAAGVRTSTGREILARAGVLADTGAPQLYRELLASQDRPPRTLRRLGGFQYDNSTIKLDWALSGPIPWSSPEARRAGTIHLADSLDFLSDATGALERRMIPERPFLIFGQYSQADPSRSPEGTETAWAYSHVPQQTRGDIRGVLTGRWDAAELEAYAERMEDEVERHAPGFRKLILGRSVMGPHELEAHDRNLVGGALNGGTAQFHQQLVFRPVLGWGRPETPIPGLYLASASAHPGGGVHGAPGANAAQALLHSRWRRRRWGAG
ncbi:MAG TPA: NAD(P)/FAD-dependent oxidoreductase [Solirubrobacteraceae bacterium]|nr:NAD(P)/FAD-dependent oxidoreductase [Solirubrobacteraceae bacterium]